MNADMNYGKDPITKADLMSFQEGLLVSMQEQFATAERRTQEQFAAAEMHMREYVESIETRLLTASQQWAVPVNSRMRRIELGEAGVNERLITIEERIMSLQKRLGPPYQSN